MKKSNKILLYGLLASILLILLCLYAHQDEFMIQKKELVLESEENDKPLNAVSIKEDKEKSETVEKVDLEEKEPKQEEMLKVPENNATIEQITKNSVNNKNETVEENSSSRIVPRTIFKNKENIKLKEHVKVPAPKEQISEVDKNLPIEDNKPLVDNDKPIKKQEKKKEEKKRSAKDKSVLKSTTSLESLQESIATITNRNISFYKNKSQITEKSKVTLNKVIKILKTVPNAKIVVKGYTDASGKEKTNLWISQERAKSVKRYLGKHGIPLKNIVSKGYGESELLYGDKPNSELNRRVEIEIKRK